MYNINKGGPRMLSCGTAEEMFRVVETAEL